MRRCLSNREEILPSHLDAGQLCIARRFLLFSLFSLVAFFASAQQRVTGRVSVGDTAIAGATVQVKGSKVAVQTNPDGSFSINASPNNTLVVSSIGYTTEEVRVGNTANLLIQLKSEAQQMSDVVVVGYGTQRKATITGSVSQVSGDEVSKSPSPN